MMANRSAQLRRPSAAGLLLLFPLLLSLAGCGANVCDVTGKITYRGKLVVCGSVIFVGPDGMTKVSNLNQDGTFSVTGVGVGRAQVGVVSQDPARPLDPYLAEKTHGKDVVGPVDDSARNPNAGRVVKNPPNDRSNWTEPNIDRSRWFPLPPKYEMVHTSGLVRELQKGVNQVDINLD
jgi:hypothetical protein